jgi:hypothetical protein
MSIHHDWRVCGACGHSRPFDLMVQIDCSRNEWNTHLLCPDCLRNLNCPHGCPECDPEDNDDL